MDIALSEDLKGRVKVVWGVVTEIDHAPHPGFPRHSEEVQGELRSTYGGLQPAAIPLLRSARDMYRSVGMEPTRHRPSSEALLRRVLQGKELYRIVPVVDTGNLFSLASGFPLGLYDMERIQGGIEIRLGLENESYQGIGKGRINVGERLCLGDDLGAFGSPTSDSSRTRITEETDTILYLLYASGGHSEDLLRGASLDLANAFSSWNRGRLIASGYLD